MTLTGTPSASQVREQRKQRRRLIAVFAVTQTLGYGVMIQAFGVLLVPIAADLGVSRTAVAAAATVSTLIGAIAAIPVGRMLDRHGGRLMMTLGSIAAVLAVVIWSQAHSLTQLYVAFALIGLALAMSTYEAAFAVIVAATDRTQRDRVILAVTMITGLATSLYFPLTGWLESHWGWRNSLLILASALLIIGVPAHIWAVPSRADHASQIHRRHGVGIGDALRTKRFWLLTVAFVCQSGTIAAFLVMMVSYFRDVGHSPVVAAAMPTVLGVMQVIARLSLTRMAARFGMARVTAVAFAVQALGLLTLPLVGASVGLTVMCVGAVGLGQGVAVIARPSIVADTFGAARFASIVGVMTVPIALSRAGAPLGAAWLGDWRFIVLGGIASLIAAVAIGIRRRPPRFVEITDTSPA